MPLAVTNPYAKALLAVVSKPGSTLGAGQALEQLGAIEALIQGCPELRVARARDQRGAEEGRDRAAERMLGLHALMKKVWDVVISHRRIPLLASVRQATQVELDEKLGIARAEVTAARRGIRSSRRRWRRSWRLGLRRKACAAPIRWTRGCWAV